MRRRCTAKLRPTGRSPHEPARARHRRASRLPLSPPRARAPPTASSNSSPRRSGIRARAAPMRAAMELCDWLEAKGVTQLAASESARVATSIEHLTRARSAPAAKLRLAALRHLFDWMAIGQIMPTNSAAAVRGPRHSVADFGTAGHGIVGLAPSRRAGKFRANQMGANVAIVGAGPAGIASAKAALECGLDPTVFEAASGLGGLWKSAGGFTWPGMKTNLSHWNCSFSDYPWPEGTEDFPTSDQVEAYLIGYAMSMNVLSRVRFRQRVAKVRPQEGRWEVSLESGASAAFDYVVLATGIFARPRSPAISGADRYRGNVLHSSSYRGRDLPGRVVVVGGSLSGVEIAAQLAESGTHCTVIASEFPWIMPRFVSREAGPSVPIDLMLYHRTAGAGSNLSVGERNKSAAQFYEAAFGNPGKVNPILRKSIDDRPPYLAISDNFLKHVADGKITPLRDRIVKFSETGIELASGQSLKADHVVMCTGYDADFSILSAELLTALEYDSSDLLTPFVADRTICHPQTQGLFFVGLYRGPYFAVIELQARTVAMMMAGRIPSPDPLASLKNLTAEREIRNRRPRPQFPHGDYVEFADLFANGMGVTPPSETGDPELDLALSKGAVTPAQYRLAGPDANFEIAREGVLSAFRRLS